MDDIVSQIQTLASKTDLAGRTSIQNALRQPLSDLGEPVDTYLQRYNGNLRNAVILLGCSSGLFQSLSQSRGHIILRYLALNNVIDEAGQGQFKANKVTHSLADQKAEIFLRYTSDFAEHKIQAFSDFIVETGYADVIDGTRTRFQKAFNNKLPCFAWLSQHPYQLKLFQQVIKSPQSGEWILEFDEFEREALATERNPERGFLWTSLVVPATSVLNLGDKYPRLKDRLVLQDLPQVVKELPQIYGVRVEATDFLQEQSVKGAKFYCLRRILHDWPGSQCIQILRSLRAAMASDSRILIDELVFPETDVERTRAQWAKLAEDSGQRIAHIHRYDEASACQPIITLELDQI
ncbi:O-methyltransferase-domain-containing protein [Aspergillus aurantiobrunneus]